MNLKILQATAAKKTAEVLFERSQENLQMAPKQIQQSHVIWDKDISEKRDLNVFQEMLHWVGAL